MSSAARCHKPTAPELGVVVLRRPVLRIVQIRGKLDILTSPVLRECLRIQLIMKPRILVVDLSQIEFLGAAGVDVVLEARRTGASLGCDVLVANTLHYAGAVCAIGRARAARTHAPAP